MFVKNRLPLLIKTAIVCFCMQLNVIHMNAQMLENQYKIFSVKERKQVNLNQLIKEAKGFQVIQFGEEHNDSVGHFLELSIFKELNLAFGQQLALSMEMFERDVQLVLDEYLKSLIKEKNFINEARCWKNYNDYKPLIEYAREKKLAVIAANAPARYVNRVARLGMASLNDLSEDARKWLPSLPIDTLEGAYYNKFLETMGGHSMPGMQIYQSQNLWDASMAEAIVTFINKNKGYKVFQLNGRFHSDEYLGTCYRLKKAGLKVMTISCFSDNSFENPDFSKFLNLADYVIITDPKVKRSF
ncbi:ChaN family lipoprotein [Solitalea sp. MAHUQ-68]|uniref:ChaN family lipoprotein n=1 Tax=Solitalea agri TaxID=2953739 RepID=A0A9X2F4S1_9SPHI|nr:ChaN family lipoprotein [Solitalea agri]MCO4292321.1 ChaN family lipoprotein [Solitalea agri]